MKIKFTVFVMSIVLMTICINAQVPYLVKNMNPSIAPSINYIDNLTDVNGTLFFANTNGGYYMSLWKSDGTSSGTVMVKGSTVPIDPKNLTNVNGTLFFSGHSYPDGRELWKSDGTTAGTFQVKNISELIYTDSKPENFIEINGVLFFWADNGTNGIELWKSDGSAAGTVMVKDIDLNYAYNQSTSGFANVNGVLFFGARTDSTGVELWKSDGTEAGTEMVKDIWKGINPDNLMGYGSSPQNLVNVNGTLFFIADDGIHGRELWKSNGTDVGTVMVKDIYPEGTTPIAGYFSTLLTNVNGTLFFMGYDGGTTYNQLWKSDGTEVGTVMVKSLSSGPGVQGEFTVMNSTLYFGATTDNKGYELWKSDGTNSGTVLVKDINPGNDPGLDYSRSYLVPINGTLYFSANDKATGFELWKSDGTEAGTAMVMDIDPTNSNNGSHPKRLTNVHGTLFFTPFEPNTGNELWALKTSTGVIDQYTSQKLFEFYPNPTKNQVTIICADRITAAEAYDIKGTLQHIELLGNVMDVSKLSSGTHFFKLHTINGVAIQKIIIE